MTDIQGGRPGRPAEVERSLFWWWFAIGGQILSDIVQIILPGSANSITRLVFPTVQAPASSVSVVGIVIQVVTLVIWVALVYNVGQGSNGARWVLTVLAAIEELFLLGLIVTCFLLPSVGSVVVGVLGLGVFVAALLAIIAMSQPGARIHFQRLT